METKKSSHTSTKQSVEFALLLSSTLGAKIPLIFWNFGPRLCRIEVMEAAEAIVNEVKINPFQEPNKIELSNFD